MEANNKSSQLFFNVGKYNPYTGKDTSATKTDNSIMQRERVWHKNYPYRGEDVSEGFSPNMLLLTPAIFGGLGAFMVSSLLRRRKPSEDIENRVDGEVSGQSLETSRGFYKLELFLNVLSIISLVGCTAYVYQGIMEDGGITRFSAVASTVIIIIFLFASEDYLLYTICPECYDGVTGNSAVGDFLNFVVLNIGAISVGESFGLTAKTTGTKLLLAQESLFNLFVLALLISFVV